MPEPEARERLLGPGELLGEVGGDPRGDDSLGKKVLVLLTLSTVSTAGTLDT